MRRFVRFSSRVAERWHRVFVIATGPKHQARGQSHSARGGLNSVARNGEADCGHHDGQANRAQKVMHPAEPGIETEEETQHWRILLRQLLTNCFPSDERAPVPVALWFPIAVRKL